MRELEIKADGNSEIARDRERLAENEGEKRHIDEIKRNCRRNDRERDVGRRDGKTK